MDTDVVEQSAAGIAAGGEPVAGGEVGTGSPEETVDEVDHLLDEVEAALTRLDQGTYGTCGACGSAIDDGRLSADPTTRTCAACDGDVTDPGPSPLDAVVDDVLDDLGDDRDDDVEEAVETGPSSLPSPSPWSERGASAD